MSANEKELNLSFLDQKSHFRVYGRYYIVFSFPDVKHADTAISSLRIGFKEVLRQFPYLSGSVRMPYIAKDNLQVLFPSSIDLEVEASRIFTASLHDATDVNYTYTKLAGTHFLPEKFPAEFFCPALIKHHPGLDDGDPFAERRTSLTKGPLPVFAAHATFIPGGLVLSVWFHHAFMDGAGNATLQQVWSAAVRSLRQPTQETGYTNAGLEAKPDDDAADPNLSRSGLSNLIHELHVEPDSTWSGKRFQYSTHPLREPPYKVITKMFRFPGPVVNGLRKAISNVQKTHVSHFSALAAVIWANIIQARLPLLIASGSTKSTLAIVVDLRKHLRAPFSSPNYLGNLVFSEMPTWDLFEQANSIITRVVKGADHSQEDSQDSTPRMTIQEARLKIVVPTLACIAAEIHEAVHSIDEKWVGKQLAQVLANPAYTDHTILKFSNGPDLYITSWQHMGADLEWCIPGTASAQPSAIRRAAWVNEGGIVVLPRKSDKEGKVPAPYEVMVSLAEVDMEAFEHSLEEGRWLRDRCSNI